MIHRCKINPLAGISFDLPSRAERGALAGDSLMEFHRSAAKPSSSFRSAHITLDDAGA